MKIGLAALLTLAALVPTAQGQSFVNFESGQVRPLALSPDGAWLFAVNTPDNRLAIYAVLGGGLTPASEVPVGLEPVAVAVRATGGGMLEAWVVNHLSDSVSVVAVDPSNPGQARVVRTVLVGDEPRDVVFAGVGGARAFITTARRGQNLPSSVAASLTTAGTPRALVWAFDVNNLGASLEGTPLSIIPLFSDTPRALAVSPDGATVYAAAFHSGNQTASVTGARVARTATSPHGLPPAPTGATAGAPTTGLIVKWNGTQWVDEINRDWSDAVPFFLPDRDVFLINANANPPVAAGGTNFVTGVGTVLFNMAVRADTGSVYVTNTEARNEIRFEPAIVGHNTESRITVIQGTTATPHHLNPHINYAFPTGPQSEIDQSLAQPLDLVFSGDGSKVYVAGFGSAQVGVFDTNALEAGMISKQLIEVGAGPTGLALDEANDRLYVMNRIEHSISIVDLTTAVEIDRLPVHFDPEPLEVRAGRRFLYDARNTSGHGDGSCASCHVFADFDSIAWDLGNPFAAVIPNLIPKNNTPGVARINFHPMKGPMTTQSLRGMLGAGAMHWRGDRNGAAAPDGSVTPGGDPFDEVAAFKRFNGAFTDLQGRASQLSAADMQAFTDFILTVQYPPNPIKALTNVDNAAEATGRTVFQTETIFGGLFANDGLGQNCNTCHTVPITTSREMAQAGLTGGVQEMKNPHLRNAYQKIGAFGVAANSIPNNFFGTSFLGQQLVGDQVRGFGFSHDGSVSTIFNFLNNGTFVTAGGAAGTAQRQNLEAFILATDTGLRPIVGQQVTLTESNAAVVGARIDLLIARAAAGDADVIVKGVSGGQARGWYQTAAGTFRPDRASEPLLSDASLRSLAATPGQPLTYTAAPPGSGVRMGIDRDEDGYFDRDELDAGSDPADPASIPGAATATHTATVPPPATDTATPVPPTVTDTVPPTVTKTATPVPPPTETATACIGDCDGDRLVPINELIVGVNVALGRAPVESCAAFDRNRDSQVTIDELLAGVNNASGGCPPDPTPTPTQTPVPVVDARARQRGLPLRRLHRRAAGGVAPTAQTQQAAVQGEGRRPGAARYGDADGLFPRRLRRHGATGQRPRAARRGVAQRPLDRSGVDLAARSSATKLFVTRASLIGCLRFDSVSSQPCMLTRISTASASGSAHLSRSAATA